MFLWVRLLSQERPSIALEYDEKFSFGAVVFIHREPVVALFVPGLKCIVILLPVSGI